MDLHKTPKIKPVKPTTEPDKKEKPDENSPWIPPNIPPIKPPFRGIK